MPGRLSDRRLIVKAMRPVIFLHIARDGLDCRNVHYCGVTSMSFWQRLLFLLAAVLAVSLLFSLLWQQLFNFALPAYVVGLVGGLTAVPVWDTLKRTKR